MLVFAKKKLVILAMPKTGTTSLEASLAPKADLVFRNPPNLKHTPAHRYYKSLRPYLEAGGLEGLELVCALREPIDWLGSWYRYRTRPAKDGMPTSTKGMSFDEYVNDYLKGKPPEWAKVGHPERFIRRGTGEMIVDHLFQYEQMDLMYDFLSERLDVEIDVKERNVSPPGDLTLSDKTRTKLLRKRPGMFSDWEKARR